jgi:hypothetical protein
MGGYENLYQMGMIWQACAVFYVVRRTWAEFGVHAVNVKFSTKNK